ncbi:hypothetical protein VT84_02055 [Gemmata sp. SH-PL17]|uniref:hypothetical protein n=1 Tax=Gemmata sp. SH-PL17 TaxID=1630693 RepID=UPI00078E2078|nr:hypothetical protein [Gemmata sp. SH-PL17]AMV23165.1 hypothetical protein VT84_02055 [Gemmata sp. SH-PL17]
MNCQVVQNQILDLPNPRELTAVMLAHVAECAACQAWAQRAARLESLIEQLPVPPAPAEKKEALIGELLAADPVIRPMVVPASRPGLATIAGQFLLRNATYVGGLAAAVLVVVGIAWYANKPGPHVVVATPEERHPLVEKLVARDIALARAETPAKRLEALGGMADDLASETRGMARIASSAELKELARQYDRVVKDGMVRRAQELPALMPRSEKQKLLDTLATKLETDASEADKLSREAPQDAQPTLKRIADTAREGARELALAREGK